MCYVYLKAFTKRAHSNITAVRMYYRAATPRAMLVSKEMQYLLNSEKYVYTRIYNFRRFALQIRSVSINKSISQNKLELEEILWKFPKYWFGHFYSSIV